MASRRPAAVAHDAVSGGSAGTRAAARTVTRGLMSAGTCELDGGMKLPQRLARFNRHLTNPIQRMWAGWAPSFAISRAEAAQHVTRGRRIFARIPFEEAVLFTKTG
jgi:hypothetical protein